MPRRNSLVPLLLFLALVLGAGASAAAQSPPPAKNDSAQEPLIPDPDAADPLRGSVSSGFTLKKEVEEVILHATVLDDKQRMVSGLDRNAFTIYEDSGRGFQAQPITSFRHEDIPVAVGILVDNSASMRNKRAAVTQAALNFVRASNPLDLVFIVNFNDQAYIDADFTNSIPKLREALDNLDSRGATALYDAVGASADHFTKDLAEAAKGRPKFDKTVLLVITDGIDNSSTESLENTVQLLQGEDSPAVYCIGILNHEDRRKGRRALQALSDSTGGVAYFPNDLNEVDTITQQVAHDIRNQYTLGFKKNPQGGTGYRAVRVEARAAGYRNLQVRTRSGYVPGSGKR